MAGEWRVTTLGEFVRLQRGHDLTAEERVPGNFPVMGSAGQNGTHGKFISRGPGVVIGRSGASMGRVHYVPSDYWPHNTCLYVTDFLGNDPRFTFYFLGALDLASYNSGSAQPSLNRNFVYTKPITIPSPKEQRAIAHILGTLDDKIEFNRRRNQTLEAMARALFKDWFVDFGPVRAKMEGRDPYLPADLWQLFPDRLDDEGKPEGWEIHPLDQIAALVTNSIAPGKSPEAVFEHYSIPAFDVGRMPAMEVGESIKSNKYIVDPDSVLVSKLNPQTPRVWLPAVATDRAICSTEFMQFVPHDRENRSYLYCLMSSRTMQEVVLQHVTGSTGSRQRAQPSQIAKVNILTPSPSVVMAFNRQAGPILKAVGENHRESQTLAQLRDTLLPKLISGELRIKDAERFIERAS